MYPPKLSLKEEYLRYVERELMIKGGRWVATFDVAIRDFNISTLSEKYTKSDQKHNIDSLIYGGVRHKGFILSRAFSFMASPTYRVGCAVIHLTNIINARWSFLVEYIREVGSIKEKMEFEWMWLLFFGEGKLKSKVIKNINQHSSRELGILYADLKNVEIQVSDSFIARHGLKLFHPKNLAKQSSRLKFWSN
ncbi:MAG: hypothetical protein ACFFFH_14310 [Candidatus Thorarchaeota archaeon]